MRSLLAGFLLAAFALLGPVAAGQNPVDIGVNPNNGQGDVPRTAYTKLNANDADLYAAISSINTTLASIALTSPVTSVGGRSGAVILSSTDISDATATGRAVMTASSYPALLSAIGAAPIASPAFTGSPTAPVPAAGDSSAKIPTTSWVSNKLSGYLLSATAASTYAPLASPTFTGTLTVPATQITGTAALGGPDGVAPTLSGTGYQIYARRYATGTTSNGANLSLINVEGDNATVTGANFLNAFAVQNAAFGGPNVQGGRQAIQASVNQTAATSASNTNRNYVGLYAGASSSSGDGGTDLTTAGAKGGYFGINPVCILNSGATNTLNCSAAEVNIAVKTGASTNYKSGIQIAQLPFDAVQGSATDAAIVISNQAGAVGWKNGILFSDANGQSALNPNSYILQSYGPGLGTVAITALGVIQTSNLGGTGISPVFASPTGVLSRTPTPVPASSTAACSVGQYAAAAGFAYFCVAANTWQRAALSTF